MSTAGITADGVARSFGPVHAVRSATLHAQAGKVTALIGPNGSGKTTLFLMLASLLSPDAGTIRIGGLDPLADAAGVRSQLGWMPDSLGAWPALTARETLVTTARLYSMTKDAAKARADELLGIVGLEPLADSPARVLSRGQKQRLGLARALVHDPGVLLLDEPASGLDPQARVDLRILLRRFANEGRTVLVSSHVLAELEEVADEAVFLVAGETVGHDRVAQAARSLRDWRIRPVTDDITTAAALITSALARERVSVRIDRRDVLVAFESEDAAAAGLAALVQAGITISEYAPATGTLEHTFLDLGTEGGGAA